MCIQSIHASERASGAEDPPVRVEAIFTLEKLEVRPPAHY
jgi:hypothetical protein